MNGWRIVFPERGRAELEPCEVGEPRAGEVRYRTLVSLVSPGTEVAKFTGLQVIDYPWVPGYAAIGEVIDWGDGVTGLAPGGRIFTYGPHASYACSTVLWAPVPDEVPTEHAPFVRLASVALTAVRVSSVELGDAVAVLGLGLVGNFAAQLFQLAGAEVFGVEPSARRREVAVRCGIRQVVDTADDGGVAEVRRLSGGGVQCTVEAVGHPPLVDAACAMTAPRGEVIWVGSPRGSWVTDATEILNRVHLWQHGCLTFKGAHEWRIPVRPAEGAKHSLQSHAEYLLRLLAAQRLAVSPLLTHALPPDRCQEAYEGLRDHKEEYLGVLFDWR